MTNISNVSWTILFCVSHYFHTICDIPVDLVVAVVATSATLSLMWTSPLEQAVQRALVTIPPLQCLRLAFMSLTSRKSRHSLGRNQQGLKHRPLLEVFNCFKSNMRVQLLDLQHHYMLFSTFLSMTHSRCLKLPFE